MLDKSIRFNALRISLVDAIMTSSECTGITFCTSPNCCLYLCRLANRFGLKINKHVEEDDYSDRCLEFYDPQLASESAKKALAALSFQHEVGRYADEYAAYDLLIEIPSVPTSVLTHFQNQHEDFLNTSLPKSRQFALKRQVAFILVSLAFPDSYLDRFSHETIDGGDGTDLNLKSSWAKWVEVFNSIEMPILELPSSITDSISDEGPWTKSFFGESGCWNEAAGYDLEIGGKDGSSSLKDYVERFPSLEHYFTWYDRSNGYNTFGGFLVRCDGLLVSQTWTFGNKENNFFVRNFNEHLAPMLTAQPQSHFDRIIVVYSDFNGYSYLASTDPRSWEQDTQAIRLSGSLPDGYGWVATFNTTTDYARGSLESFESDIYTPRLQAAARYLARCIEHRQHISKENYEIDEYDN